MPQRSGFGSWLKKRWWVPVLVAVAVGLAVSDDDDQGEAIAAIRLRIDAAERDLDVGANNLTYMDDLVDRIGNDVEVEP